MGALTLHVSDVQVVNGSAACHLEVINELGRCLPISGAWFLHTRSNAGNDDLSAVLHSELADDRSHMTLHRLGVDEHHLSNLLVAHSLAKGFSDFRLSLRQVTQDLTLLKSRHLPNLRGNRTQPSEWLPGT